MRSQQYVEAGWTRVREQLEKDASPAELDRARQLYFAGALHLWITLVDMLGDSKLSRRRKDRRLIHIQTELETWVDSMSQHEVH